LDRVRTRTGAKCALIQDLPGARGYELGFALCGVLMIAGGLLGCWTIDPLRSLRYAAT
jgi:hypothetical protein